MLILITSVLTCAKKPKSNNLVRLEITEIDGYLPVLWNPNLWSLSFGLFDVIRKNGLEEENLLRSKFTGIIELIDKNSKA